jgi:hypothetical protein
VVSISRNPNAAAVARVRGEQQRVVAAVRDVRLVARPSPRAQLRHRHAELVRPQQREDGGQLRRRRPARQPHDLGRGTAGATSRRANATSSSAIACARRVEVDAVRRDERVDDVELASGRPSSSTTRPSRTRATAPGRPATKRDEPEPADPRRRTRRG